jgi:hypothetical protein
MKKVFILLIVGIVNYAGSLAFAQPKNKSLAPVMQALLPYTNVVDLQVKAQRIKGVREMLNFVLIQYPTPPAPDQALISLYQAKQEYWQAIVLEQAREAIKIKDELDNDPRAKGILHFHFRNNLASIAKCIELLTPNVETKVEIDCYMRVWRAFVWAGGNARERAKILKSSDERESASMEAHFLREAELLMVGLIAGSSGFSKEYSNIFNNCGTGLEFEFKLYLNKCERTRAPDDRAGKQSK